MDTPLFTYQPIQGNDQVRVLILNQGINDDPLRGSLCHFSLQDIEGHYEALSYTWGEDPARHRMEIDGKPFLVRENLAAALYQLRRPRTVLAIWVDAICINQDDVEERNSQIRHMQDVYKSAYRVVAWLGKESDNSEIAMSSNLAGKYAYQRNAATPPLDAILDADTRQAVQKLLQRSWWSRVWIIQESVVAKSVTVQCGNSSFIWRKPSHERALPVDVQTLLESGAQTTYSDAASRLYQFWHEYNTDLGKKSLLSLLITFWHCQATDPRDKVFAITGLATPLNGVAFVIDYRPTVSEVYEAVARYITENAGGLDILACAGLGYSRYSRYPLSNLPSWIPDWSSSHPAAQKPLRLAHLQRSDRFYNAGLERRGGIKIEGDSLSIEGVHVGEIVISEGLEIQGQNDVLLPKLKVKIEDLCDELGLSPFKLITTLTADYATDTSTVLASHAEAIATFSVILWNTRDTTSAPAMLRLNRAQSTLCNNVSEAILNACLGRSIFKAGPEGSYIGLASKIARPGDRIFIPFGSETPLVLRESGNGSSFLLIGECYVDGLMYGDFLKDAALGGRDQSARIRIR